MLKRFLLIVILKNFESHEIENLINFRSKSRCTSYFFILVEQYCFIAEWFWSSCCIVASQWQDISVWFPSGDRRS